MAERKKKKKPEQKKAAQAIFKREVEAGRAAPGDIPRPKVTVTQPTPGGERRAVAPTGKVGERTPVFDLTTQKRAIEVAAIEQQKRAALEAEVGAETLEARKAETPELAQLGDITEPEITPTSVVRSFFGGITQAIPLIGPAISKLKKADVATLMKDFRTASGQNFAQLENNINAGMSAYDAVNSFNEQLETIAKSDGEMKRLISENSALVLGNAGAQRIEIEAWYQRWSTPGTRDLFFLRQRFENLIAMPVPGAVTEVPQAASTPPAGPGGLGIGGIL